MSGDHQPTRTLTRVEANEFRTLGLTPGHWAALSPVPLFREDLRQPDRAAFASFHTLGTLLGGVAKPRAEAERFWTGLLATDEVEDELEIAYALLGWHLVHDLTRKRREEYLNLLDRAGRGRKAANARAVNVARDVRRWIDPYFAVAEYTRDPQPITLDPPDSAEVGRLLGPNLWKQFLTAPLAAALAERRTQPEAVHGIVSRLSAVTEPDPFASPHPLERHLTPGWLVPFERLIDPTRPSAPPPTDDAIRIAARGLATLEFDERETILTSIGNMIREAVPDADRAAFASQWIDRVREEIETVLIDCRPKTTSAEPIEATLVAPGTATAVIWQCGHCGIENPPGTAQCIVCGNPCPPRLVLRSEATGQEVQLQTGLRIGKALFRHRLNDPDAEFAAEAQFEVVRNEIAAAWIVRPLPGVWNPTYYNGTPLGPDGIQLEDGGVISIGQHRLKLRVLLKPH